VRYGVIADVHGNMPALEAVLEALGRIGVDAYACAGDLVGYGPEPNECVEVVRRLGAECVAGNHDLIALGELSEDRCERFARESLRWTRAALDDATRDYLARLPRRLELPGGVVVAHGSLDDPQEYVLRVDQAAVQLDRLAETHPQAGILVVGHTHRAFASDGASATRRGRVTLDGSDRWLLNPGAVGQSREALVRARFMVLDLERREAAFHAIRYDVRRSRALLRRHDRPTRSVHLPPWRLKALLRPAIRVVRRAQARIRRP
jgi:predicted phosphodiesterase